MAQEGLPFKLITPTGVLFDDTVREVIAVNPLGEFGVLPEHVNYITSVEPCVVTVKLNDGTLRLFVVSGGLAEVKDGVLTILSSSAEAAEAVVDSGQLSQEIIAAEQRLQGISFYEPAYNNALKAVQLARARELAVRLRTQPR
jgi:F-type H+-transporting ATPase subunit epsilon